MKRIYFILAFIMFALVMFGIVPVIGGNECTAWKPAGCFSASTRGVKQCSITCGTDESQRTACYGCCKKFFENDVDGVCIMPDGEYVVNPDTCTGVGGRYMTIKVACENACGPPI